MKKRVISLLLAAMVFGCHGVGAQSLSDNYSCIFVATDGNDANSGSIDKPFATLERAKQEVQKIKNGEGKGKKGIVVYIRGGEYRLEKSLEFSEADSGTAETPIIYRNYMNEEVTFTGGMHIPGSAFKKTNDAMVKRIVDESARDKIYAVNLHDLGVDKMPERALLGQYSDIAQMRKIYPEINNMQTRGGDYELFADGVAMTPARYPNGEENMKIKEWSGLTATGKSDAEIEEIKNIPEDKRQTFEVLPTDERSKNWTNAKNALIWGLFGQDWADATIPVREVTDKGVIITKFMSFYGGREGAPFYIYNLIEELDSPGEYYLDPDSGVLYFYPDGDISDMKINLSLMSDSAVVLNKCSYITFKNLDFTVLRGRTFYLDNAENVVIDGSEISYTAGQAVYMTGGKNNGVKNCYVHDTNGGVRLYGSGDRATLTPGGTYVENCEFENYARLTKTYNYAIGFHGGVGNRMSYNEVHGAPHAAISGNGNNLLIEYNEIYDVCKETDDAGAFYVGRETMTRGNVIKYNYFHDIGSSISGSMGVRAIYFDDGFSSYDVIGNVLENIAGAGVFVGSGRDFIVYNNMFINVTTPIRGAHYSNLESLTDYKNPENQKIIKSDIWKEAYPELYDMTEEDVATPAGNVFDTNLLYKSGPNQILESLKRTGVEKNNYETSDDPGFYDEENRNYLLKKDAPIFEELQGFKPVPFTRMGRYTDRALDRISEAAVLCIGSPYAYVKGEKTTVDESTEVMPVIMDNLTYLPVRFVAETMGAEVEYNDAEKIITIKTEDNTATIDAKTSQFFRNGESVETQGQVKIKDGRTLIPVRTMSEILDKQIFWDDIGFVTVSDTPDLFNPESDRELIDYLHGQLTLY